MKRAEVRKAAVELVLGANDDRLNADRIADKIRGATKSVSKEALRIFAGFAPVTPQEKIAYELDKAGQ